MVNVDVKKAFFIFVIQGSTDGEQTQRSPSDEGFTELEPTVNGSTVEAGGSPSVTLNIVSKDQQELGPGQVDLENKSKLGQTKGKLEDDEDEGVAQNSSTEDAESILSSSETEKQGDKTTSQELHGTKDNTKVTEELLSDANNITDTTPGDQHRKVSLKEVTGDHGDSSPERQSPDKPVGGPQINEDDRQKKSYEAEMKSWLLEKMQAPIEGMDQTGY